MTPLTYTEATLRAPEEQEVVVCVHMYIHSLTFDTCTYYMCVCHVIVPYLYVHCQYNICSIFLSLKYLYLCDFIMSICSS